MTSNEYITKNEAKQAVLDCILSFEMIYPSEAIRNIDEIKPRNVETVRHGFWNYIKFYMGTVRNVFKCSECESLFDGTIGFHFCPNCGSKMDIKEKDNEKI